MAIAAVGAAPIIPRVPGIDDPNVVNALTILDEHPEIGKSVAAVSGMIGTETAVDLAVKGHKVTIVEMKDAIMADCSITDILSYYEKIGQYQVGLMPGMRVAEVTPDGILCVSDKNGKSAKVPADSVVIAVGMRPKHGFYDALASVPDLEVYEIGDCIHAGKILDAFHTVYKTAIHI